jgi:hypothetical protein
MTKLMISVDVFLWAVDVPTKERQLYRAQELSHAVGAKVKAFVPTYGVVVSDITIGVGRPQRPTYSNIEVLTENNLSTK